MQYLSSLFLSTCTDGRVLRPPVFCPYIYSHGYTIRKAMICCLPASMRLSILLTPQ